MLCADCSDHRVCVCYLQVEKCVKVRDDDVSVFHFAPHVFNGVDGRLVVGLRAASRRETLQPHAACLTQLIKHQTSQLHRLDLCTGTHTHTQVPVLIRHCEGLQHYFDKSLQS